MTKFNLEIDTNDPLPSYDADGELNPPADLQSLVVEAAARQIVRSDDFDRQVKKRVEQIIEELVEDHATVAVRAAFTGPIQRTTPWGEAKGEPTTIREIVREHIEKFVNTPSQRDSYGKANKNSLSGLTEDLIRDVMTKELKTAINEAKAKVTNEIRNKALKAAVDALTPTR